nr:immunoglobulin heavy chain junction region [Mus musculus]
FCARAVGGFDF